MFNASSLLSTWKKFTHRSPLYMVIFLAMLLLLIRSKKEQRKYISIVFVLLFILVFNPISYSVLFSIAGASSYRILWLLPAWAAFAYIAMNGIQIIPSANLRLLVATIVSILLTVYCVHNNSYDFTMSNPYQIPQDTIELADKMEEIMDERGIDYAVLYGNSDFLSTLRQYSARFILQISPRDHSLMEENAEQNNYLGLGQFITTGESPIEKDYAADILYNNNVYFIVIHRELTASIEYLTSMGWYEVTGNNSYIVLCQDAWDDLHDE